MDWSGLRMNGIIYHNKVDMELDMEQKIKEIEEQLKILKEEAKQAKEEEAKKTRMLEEESKKVKMLEEEAKRVSTLEEEVQMLSKEVQMLSEEANKSLLMKSKIGLQRLLKEGLPRILKGGAPSSVSVSKTKEDMEEDKVRKYRHDPIKEAVLSDFNILDNINDHFHYDDIATSIIWNKANVTESLYSGEGMIQDYVGDVLLDLLQILGIIDNIKIQVGRNRPDIWVIKYKNMHPICICEVKQPAPKILDDKIVLGQVFDYMVLLRTYYGVREVMTILTTSKEWRFCWFKDTDPIARATSIKKMQAEIRCDDIEDILVDRTVLVSPLMLWTDATLVRSLLSFLVKTTHVHHDPVPLFSTTRKYLRICTSTKLDRDETDIIFEKLPKSFRLKLHPPNKKTEMFYVLRQFNHGLDSSEVLLACSQNGNLCVIKFVVEGGEQIDKEINLWKTFYGVDTVFSKEFGRDKRPAIIMPFAFHYQALKNVKYDFDLDIQQWSKYPETIDFTEVINFEEVSTEVLSSKLRSERKDSVARQAITEIAEKGFIHTDVQWRHVALLPIFRKHSVSREMEWAGILKPILIDLTHVVEEKDKTVALKNMLDQLNKDSESDKFT